MFYCVVLYQTWVETGSISLWETYWLRKPQINIFFVLLYFYILLNISSYIIIWLCCIWLLRVWLTRAQVLESKRPGFTPWLGNLPAMWQWSCWSVALSVKWGYQCLSSILLCFKKDQQHHFQWAYYGLKLSLYFQLNSTNIKYLLCPRWWTLEGAMNLEPKDLDSNPNSVSSYLYNMTKSLHLPEPQDSSCVKWAGCLAIWFHDSVTMMHRHFLNLRSKSAPSLGIFLNYC